jgi:hypothetical protein
MNRLGKSITFYPKQSLLVWIILSQFLCHAQTSVDLKEVKRVGHSIEIAPFGLGYTITDQINDNTAFGFGIEIGASFKYYLNNPVYLKYSFIADSVSEQVYENTKLKPTVKWRYDIVQLKLFIQKKVGQNGLLNAGASFGAGNLGGLENINTHITACALGEFYWGFKSIKAGIRIQPGITHISYNSENRTTFFSVLLTPIILKFCFN